MIDSATLGNIFEIIMLLGFAAAWPLNITRAYRARTAAGTSLGFMVVIEVAYVCGMLSKIVTDNVTYVLAFYILDFALVFTAICVYARNRNIDSSRKGRRDAGPVGFRPYRTGSRLRIPP